MKCLEINNGKGYFRSSDGTFKELDKIKKDDLLYLLDIATNSQDVFEMDDPTELSKGNPAHEIIYRNLHDKFDELSRNKTRFLDESEALYKEALQKYQK